MLPRKLLCSLLKNNRINIIRQCLPTAININQKTFLSTEISKPAETIKEQPLNYSQEESKKIVNIFNSSSLDELARFHITKLGLSKLKLWREKHGQLQSPKDLLEIKGMNAKTLHSFCNSLLKNEPKRKALKSSSKGFKISSFVIPNIDGAQIPKIRSSIAVHIGVSSVCWSRFQIYKNEVEPCLLTDWQYQPIGQKRQHLDSLVQECLEIVEKIPSADCYLLQNPQIAQASNNLTNAEEKNVNIEKAQITAMLSFAFNARRRALKDTEDQKESQIENPLESSTATTPDNKVLNYAKHLPNIFYLRNYLHSRLFRNLVGHEQISTRNTIIKLMHNYFTDLYRVDSAKLSKEERDQICGSIQFMPEHREMYESMEGFQSEFLGQALLMNLAFVRLVLVQDGESIRMVQSNKKI